uniref:Uncharacterized protein n=1 Tax=Meloidogyne hapla TaxID=6305 RepID=A0A1I8B1X6_MELHA
MAIIVCNKGIINSPSLEKIWDNLKSTILKEWFNQNRKTLNSKQKASLHISKLISTLINLDEYFYKNKNINSSTFSNCLLPSSSYSVQITNSQIIDKNNEPSLFIDYMVKIMKCYRRIWDAFYEVPDQYLSKFNKLDELFSSPDNLLGHYEEFNSNPLPMNDDERSIYFLEVSKMSIIEQHPRNTKALIVSRLLSIGIFKSLPFFKKLLPRDQGCPKYARKIAKYVHRKKYMHRKSSKYALKYPKYA